MADPIFEKRQSSSDLLISTLNELSKIHIEYDAADRPEFIFTAPRYTKNNERCICVKYVYRGPTSQQVMNQTEFNALWDSSWDDTDVPALEVTK